MQYTLFAAKDNAEGQLNSNIGGATLTIVLNAGEGANFPQPLSSTTSSGGSNILLNKTGIGATGVVAGDFIENVTDGSQAYVLTVNTDSLVTTQLQQGSDNTWENGDTYRIRSFVGTLNSRVAGVMVNNEKVKIIARVGDTLTVDPAGRGFDGSVAQAFNADDYFNLFVTSALIEGYRKALQDASRQMDLKASLIYVDAALNARVWKDPVVVATTVAGTLATSFENGDTIDGVVLVTGDRILIKNQASPIENGIYVVAASGAPTRASDFDATAEVTGAAISIIKGTSLQDSVWICTSDSPVIGVNDIVFSQVGSSVTKANQATAEAATDDNEYMTPLQTKNAMAYHGDIENGILGDTVSSGDITSNLNLLYLNRSDMRWYKVTSDETTWVKELALAIEAGTSGNRVKLLRRGIYANQTFANINPTISSSLTGANIAVGSAAATSAAAITLLDNSSGAEAVVSGGTISARQQGAPAGAMLLYAVLASSEYNSTFTPDDQPACFKDTSNHVIRGAIIGYASIAQGLFSGSYQNLAYTWKDRNGNNINVKIPAGFMVYIVVAKTGAVNGSNYYEIQSNGASKALNETTMVWSGTVNGGNQTTTVVSTSPIGYGVKAYAGTAGGYSLTPTNRWTKVIGQVISSTEFYFNPNPGLEKSWQHILNLTATGFLETYTVNLGFCPSEIEFLQSKKLDATTDTVALRKGYLRCDLGGLVSNGQTYNCGTRACPVALSVDSTDNGNNDLHNLIDVTLPVNLSGSNDWEYARTFMGLNTNGNPDENNFIRMARLESGFYLYNTYPSGTTYISGSKAGFAQTSSALVGSAKA